MFQNLAQALDERW